MAIFIFSWNARSVDDTYASLLFFLFEFWCVFTYFDSIEDVKPTRSFSFDEVVLLITSLLLNWQVI